VITFLLAFLLLFTSTQSIQLAIAGVCGLIAVRLFYRGWRLGR
jgi:hypothetical protein